MHACGMIEGIMFTNSYDALMFWKNKGIDLFEIDIDIAEDGEYVAIHDFSQNTLENMGIEATQGYHSSIWFSKQKLYKHKTKRGLQPLLLQDIFLLMSENTQMKIMIDPKLFSYEETKALLIKIKEYCMKYSVEEYRIFFECYNIDMIRATKGVLGEFQYQYCFDEDVQVGNSKITREMEINDLIDFLKKYNVAAISYPWKLAIENLEKLRILKKAGFIIFSRTRNNIFEELLQLAGIDINLVDYLVDENERKQLRKYKEQYLLQYEQRVKKYFT